MIAPSGNIYETRLRIPDYSLPLDRLCSLALTTSNNKKAVPLDDYGN
jgi:hypothetical protein